VGLDSVLRSACRNPYVFWTCFAYVIAFIVAVALIVLFWWLSQVPTPSHVS
jgi:hypothetical protein